MNRNLLAAWAIAATLPWLAGCLPLAVTGVATGVMVAEDRRSSGAVLDDQVIETRGLADVDARYGDRAHVSITSYNYNVLLTGEAPTEAARGDIEGMVRLLPNVRSVQNDLVVGPPSSLAARTKDSFVTSKVKARFVEERKFNPLHVKVVTESGTVYLLGIVRRSEADAATGIARTTSDVVKVVRSFEYID